MAISDTSVKTFSNASVTGWNNETLADLTGLPSIPANAVLNDVKLTCSVSRNGKGPWIADGDIDFKIGGSDKAHTNDEPGRNGTINIDFSIMSKVVNNNGTLSYSSGATYIRVEVYHRNNPATGTATWTLSNAKITAYYTIPTYTITTAVTPANSGTVTGGGTFESGSSITLTATPATGYKFKQWNDGNTSATRTVTVTGNATYTAVFEKTNPPIYIRDKQCSAVYIDEANKIIYFEGGTAYLESVDEFDTVDGWHFKSVLATWDRPSGVEVVEKIYIGTTRIF